MRKLALLSAILGAACTFCYGQLIDCKEPFISEMIEGTGQNRAIEIFNPSDTVIDLDSLSIRIFKDGSVTPDIIQLNGTLAAKSKFVIAHPTANNDIKSKADMLDAQMSFDGNDAIVLEKTGGTQIDKIGEVGVDPGSAGWTCTSGTTKDQTLRRKAAIGKGETDWQQCRQQWDDFPIDNSDNLKQHLGGCGATCNTAILETANSTCTFTTYTTSGQETWFEFIATSTDVQISVVSEAFGINTPHVHNISLFGGTCASPNLIAQDELPFIAIANDLSLDASRLTPGNTYYIRANVPGTKKACTKAACPGSATVSFALCIQDINVFQPLDFDFILDNFGVEDVPTSTHTYCTNKGQIIDTDGNPRRDIKLYTIGATPEAYVTDNTVSYVFSRFDSVNADSLHRVDMTLVGASPDAKVFKTEKVGGDLNYYLGHIPNGITNMKGYSKAVCNNVYPDIDMQLSSNSEGMKYLFIRKPGGDPDDIVMKFDGASSVDVTPDGGLRVATPLGKIEFDPGHAYAINNAGNVVPMPWQAKFVKVTTNSVKFDIHSFPSFMPLVIQVDKGHKVGATGQVDNLEWSTYYGGGYADYFHNLATNPSGDVYVTGVTVSTNFPVSTGASQDTLSSSGYFDVTLVKFNDSGVRQWATYYGGTDNDGSGAPHGIAVDNSGTSYIAFSTFSNDIPIANPGGNAYVDATLNFPDIDLLIAKFDNTGQLVWSTHYGNSSIGKAFDVALNNTGELYVVGTNQNAELVTVTGAYNSTVGQGLILKFNTSGERLWATRFGGPIGSMTIHKATVDGANNLILTGFTSTTSGFPFANPGGGAYVDSTFNGGSFDAFISKFDNNDDLIWSTYWGGDDDDRSFAVATDGWDNIWLSGNTLSTDFPISRPNSFAYVDSTYNGRGSFIGTAGDAFIGKFTSGGEIRVSTYYGSTANESAANLALDDLNNLYVVGVTSSDSFPFANPNLSGGFIQSVLSDGEDGPFDGFITAFNPSFERIWTTYFGGSIYGDGPNGVTVFGDSKLYIAGIGGSPVDFPWLDLGGGAWYDANLAFASSDAFIARFDLAGIPLGIDKQSLLGSEGGFIIYPNPSNGIFTVKLNLPEADKMDLIVYDLQGKKMIIMEQEISRKHIMKLDLSRYSPGVYFVQMSTTKEVLNTKIVLTQ